MKVLFPTDDISLMHAISPIGTNFRTAKNKGPQEHKNVIDSWVPHQKAIYGSILEMNNLFENEVISPS